MNCEDYTELISAALDGELSCEEELKLDGHLSVCPQCRALMKELSALDLAMEESAEEAPEGFARRVMDAVAETEQTPAAGKMTGRRWQKLLASAAVLAIVVAGAGRFALGGIGAGGSAAPMAAADNASMESAAFTAERSGEEESKGIQPAEFAALPEADGVNLLDGAQPQEPDFYGFCNDRYIRVTWGSTPEAPSARILGSAEALAEFTARFPEDNLSELTEQYGADFFRTGRLLAVVVEEPSGSIRHTLEPQGLKRDEVSIRREAPEAGTCDMAAWLILAEVDDLFQDGQTLSVNFTE